MIECIFYVSKYNPIFIISLATKIGIDIVIVMNAQENEEFNFLTPYLRV